jgi:hypothetical protein
MPKQFNCSGSEKLPTLLVAGTVLDSSGLSLNQSITAVGQPAIQLLLREVEHLTGRWFWALKVITRQDPIPPDDRGKIKK